MEKDLNNLLYKIWEGPITRIFNRGPLEPTTDQLVKEYLALPKRKWKKIRELRDRIASSAIRDYLETNYTKSN